MSSRIVIVPVADLRREPRHGCERMSQVLYGHCVELIDQAEKFCRVRTGDGYDGFLAESYLEETDDSLPNPAVVASRWATFTMENGSELVLPFGALVYPEKSGGVYREICTQSKMTTISGDVDSVMQRAELIPNQIARTLLSAPYLWGGSSPFGYDCSGLVQAVYSRCGVNLPRDSKDQSRLGSEVTLANARDSDLIFFPGHVAICLGGLRIIHATRLRGMVVIESLDKDAPDFRADLADKVRAVRRVLP